MGPPVDVAAECHSRARRKMPSASSLNARPTASPLSASALYTSTPSASSSAHGSRSHGSRSSPYPIDQQRQIISRRSSAEAKQKRAASSLKRQPSFTEGESATISIAGDYFTAASCIVNAWQSHCNIRAQRAHEALVLGNRQADVELGTMVVPITTRSKGKVSPFNNPSRTSLSTLHSFFEGRSLQLDMAFSTQSKGTHMGPSFHSVSDRTTTSNVWTIA